MYIRYLYRMAKHTIFHYKEQCISCGACAAITPEFWEMDENGLADLKRSVQKDDHFELEITTEESRAMNQEAADVCPVNIIQLKERVEKREEKK